MEQEDERRADLMANRHTPTDLAQMQKMPLEGKILMTQLRIRAWYDHWDGDVYVSFSGGKDSTVLKHIVDGMYGTDPKNGVPCLFVNTGLEYPELQSFVRDVKARKYDCFNPDVEIVRPEMRFDEVIKKYGYPVISKEQAQFIYEYRNTKSEKLKDIRMNGNKWGRGRVTEKWKFLIDSDFAISPKCCNVMKKKPAKQFEKQTGRKPIIGTLASESKLRESEWLQNGCNAFSKARPTSQPLSFWTEQDILHYIKKFNVPYCSVYGDIVVEDSGEDVLEGQMNLIDYLGEYDEQDKLITTGCNRTGCIFCGFGCQIPKDNRFQRLKETHPRQYEYCIGGGEMVDGKWQPNKEGLGLGHILDYIGVKY